MSSRPLVSAALACCSLLFASSAVAQSYDTVFTTGNGRLRGTVIVEDAEGVTVELVDGTVRKIPRAELMRVEYASDAAAPAAPAAAAPGSEPAPGAAPSHGFAPGDAGSASSSQRTGGRIMWITGIATFVIMYPATIGIVAATAQDDDAIPLSAIPVAGPFAIIGKFGSASGPGANAGLVTSGVLQSTAVILISVGIGLDVSADESEDVALASPRGATTIVPASPGSDAGFSLVGTF